MPTLPSVSLTLLGHQSITQSETAVVSVAGAGTLDITGTAAAPITVTLSQIVAAGAAATYNMSYAHVIIAGITGVGVLETYNIGEGATLEFQNVTGAGLAASLNFTGTNGAFVIDTVYNPTVSTSFSGFGPGKSIDIKATAVASISYADNAGTNTGGILSLYGAPDPVTHNPVLLNTLAFNAGDFVGGNFSITPDGGVGTLLNYTSVVTGVTTNPGSGTVGANRAVTFTVAMSDPVSITGTPTLSLNDGGTATYDAAASTPTRLAFAYTVAAGQNTSDLAVIGVNVNNAVLNTVGGGAFSLLGAVVNPAGTLSVDTVAPIVTSTVFGQPNGVLAAGTTVTVSLGLSEAVTLGSGTPVLVLNDGGTAALDAASSTSTTLVFKHTVQAGQNSADLAIVGASLNGATIGDLAGNLLSLAGAIGNPAGTLVVDTLAPTVASVATSPGSGTLAAGQAVTFSIAMSEAVFLAGGTPTLALSDGGTATYDPVHSTATMLVFTHVVQPGQNAADLSILGTSLNGATIADIAGNALNLNGAIGNPAGLLAVGTGLVPTTPTPTGTVPTGTIPTGTVPTGTLPTGIVPAGTIPGGTTSGGTPSTGTTSGGTTSTGTTPEAGTGSVAASLAVYRFFDSRSGTHFYTTSVAERDAILKSRPDLVSEGAGLRAIDPAANDPNAREVFRFFDTTHGTQFLTSSTTERDTIIATRTDLTFEPNGSFLEHIQPQAGDTAVYRFFSTSDGTHFYTDSAAERASIIQSRPDLIAEGIGFYEPA